MKYSRQHDHIDISNYYLMLFHIYNLDILYCSGPLLVYQSINKNIERHCSFDSNVEKQVQNREHSHLCGMFSRSIAEKNNLIINLFTTAS